MDELKSCENINKNDLVVSAWLSGGCSSAVFKGEWHNDGKILVVAIKKMKVNSEEEAAEISRELKIMQSLPQENICKLYGCVVEDREREAWLVMEFAQGGDLHAFLQRHEGPLPKDLQLSFYIQATQALASLHNAPSPILHRDIKSFNYLVLPNNKLILADFGLSKAKALTTAETFTVGTVRWVAPEIVKTDRRHWSEKSDIYSLGMVYYEILTRELPYSEGHDAHLNRILDKIKNGTLPKLPDECPKDLAAIIQRCWSYKPEKRPTINELLALWPKVDLTDSPSKHKGYKKNSKEKELTSIETERIRGLEEPNKVTRRAHSLDESQLKSTWRSRRFSLDDVEFEQTVRGGTGIGRFLSSAREKIFGSKKDKRSRAFE